MSGPHTQAAAGYIQNAFTSVLAAIESGELPDNEASQLLEALLALAVKLVAKLEANA
jgi:hypothetical protein